MRVVLRGEGLGVKQSRPNVHHHEAVRLQYNLGESVPTGNSSLEI